MRRGDEKGLGGPGSVEQSQTVAAARQGAEGGGSSVEQSQTVEMVAADEELSQALPEQLRASLMAFQREGVKFAVSKNGRAILGDEMGLGKTIQAIAVASIYRNDWPCLVFMPASMRWSWAAELEKWLVELRPGDIKVIRNSQDTDNLNIARFVLCTYDLFVRSALLQTALNEAKFGVCIIDESHYCKNREAKRTKAVQSIACKTKRCILLSGTPALTYFFRRFEQLARGRYLPRNSGAYHG